MGRALRIITSVKAYSVKNSFPGNVKAEIARSCREAARNDAAKRGHNPVEEYNSIISQKTLQDGCMSRVNFRNNRTGKPLLESPYALLNQSSITLN